MRKLPNQNALVKELTALVQAEFTTVERFESEFIDILKTPKYARLYIIWGTSRNIVWDSKLFTDEINDYLQKLRDAGEIKHQTETGFIPGWETFSSKRQDGNGFYLKGHGPQ